MKRDGEKVGSHFERNGQGRSLKKIVQMRSELAVPSTASSTQSFRSTLLNVVPDARLSGPMPA